MNDKRKHIRVSYEKKVELHAEGQTFKGKSIDISNSGVQVIVNVPVSHSSVQRMTFKLPVESETVHIPCKVVRSDNNGDNEGHVLGIEFDYQTEAQMALIENYIRDVKNYQIFEDYESSEMRIIPRISCRITGVTCDKPGVTIASIDNISTDGCLISFTGDLAIHENIIIELTLPGQTRHITAPGVITYVVNNYFRNINKAGVFFSGISEIESARLQNFIIESASQYAFKTIQDRRFEHLIGDEYQIYDRKKIRDLLNQVKKRNEIINVLLENSLSMYELAMIQVDSGMEAFHAELHGDADCGKLHKGRIGYCSFSLRGSNYYFQCELLDADGKRCLFSFPDLVYQSEQRSHDRKFVDNNVFVSLELGGMPLGRLRGTLVNVSRRGFLCNVTLQPWQRMLVRSGQPVQYYFDREMGLDSFGEIRHCFEEGSMTGRTTLQIGVEAGIRRKRYRFKRYTPSLWSRKSIFNTRSYPIEMAGLVPEVVRYTDRNGREIVALLNYTRKGAVAPVVIMPPAFGKKKEVLSPFVTTLLSNFMNLGKDIVTIRYDGINRPGESYNDDMCPRRGYEMLHYRISRGLDDLESTVDFVYNNDYFRPEKVIVVAFSMSALDARKLALKDNRVHYLINVMGVTCARSSFRNITGGLDIVGNTRIGIQNGVSGVLGHILDLDTVAKDLVDNKYAYIADARYDMSRIQIPVAWIYGKYDKWIVEREVRDIMSVRAQGDREVIEIPTGHNLRSSEDAVKTFRIITGLIYRHLYGKKIRPVHPSRERMVDLITHERERLALNEIVDSRAYWKKYLVGEDRSNIGYDLYRDLDEFRAFLSHEGSLVNLRNGETMADMGCGTGIFIERMLADAVARNRDLSGARLIMVDLVPEALGRTRKKIELLRRTPGSRIPKQVNYIQVDLEPNRLLPIKRLMEDATLGIEYLRNRIEGLKSCVIDRLVELDAGIINRIVRGSTVSEEEIEYLAAYLDEDDRQVMMELNLAARFLAGELETSRTAAHAAATCGNLAYDFTKNNRNGIEFKKLKFGAGGIDFNLSFPNGEFDKISASLLVSYLFNPDEIIREFHRILKPGGLLLVSSMKPDSDISVIFTNYIDKLQKAEKEGKNRADGDTTIIAARTMLNEAASLFELEEDGYFRFYNGEELAAMMRNAGFINIQITPSMGIPPQAVIVTGIKPQISRKSEVQ